MEMMGGREEHAWELLMRGADYRRLDYGGISMAWSLAYRRLDPSLPAASYQQKIKEFLTAHGVNLNVPRCGPPPQKEWPENQKNDPQLFEAIAQCKKYGQ